MKLLCKGEYHNGPAGLHFNEAGEIEIDEIKGRFLLKDAPENFEQVKTKITITLADRPLVDEFSHPSFEEGEESEADEEGEVKASDKPEKDKALKADNKSKRK